MNDLLNKVKHRILEKDYVIKEYIKKIQFLEKVTLETSVGSLTPSYSTEDMGRKKTSPVTFFPDGSVRTIPLQEATIINTSLGKIKAELLSFYDNGNIKKIFPLNGKLSGYWSEKDEYQLAEEIEIETKAIHIKAKIINIGFYKSGALKSITLWPGENFLAMTPAGKAKIHKGISFHEDGSIASVEPAEPFNVLTPIGLIEAYDPEPIGISGDKNSLSFTEKGFVESVKTVSNKINIFSTDQNIVSYEPKEIPSLCSDDDMVIMPLCLRFYDDKVSFKHSMAILGVEDVSSVLDISEFIPDKAQPVKYSCS